MKFETETEIPVSDPVRLMSVFMTHIEEEHDLRFDQEKDGARSLEQDGFLIRFKPAPQGLYIRIAGPSESAFVFFKEEISEIVKEIDRTAAVNIRWSKELSETGKLPPNFKVLTLKESVCLFEGMQRLTLTHEDIRHFVSEDVHVRMMMPADPRRSAVWPRMGANGAPVWPRGEDKLHARFVTLRSVREAECEVDVDIACHDGGLVSDWALQAKPGQTVGMMGPIGSARLKFSQNLFLAADGTGLGMIARLLETAPDEATGNVVVAVPADFDVTAYFPKTRLNIITVDPEKFEQEVFDVAVDLTAPGKTGYAFFAGEFQNAQELRKMFKGRLGLDKNTQLSTAYWRRGVPGHGS